MQCSTKGHGYSKPIWHWIKDGVFIDDGISGYLFDRPAFSQLQEDLSKDIDTLFAKDFSRLGRHNAKVLLFLDLFQAGGRRLIVIDDAYDSENAEDDIVGIKTWYNERYVKDTSRKIKRVFAARQQAGTLLTQVPFGYLRNEQQKEKIEILPTEAETVQLIFQLYIQGMGYRKIAAWLNKNEIKTPSLCRHERQLAQGIHSKQRLAFLWSDAMVKDILANDFYIGNYRLHKRARATVHGADKRVPKDQQKLFEQHHPPIIEKQSFELVCKIKEQRKQLHYRGTRTQDFTTAETDPFLNRLFCKDCGKKLTPIVRRSAKQAKHYYICSTYNAKGRTFCAKAHLIKAEDLMQDILSFLSLFKAPLSEIIAADAASKQQAAAISCERKQLALQKQLQSQKNRLKALLVQKTKDITAHPGHQALIAESYHTIEHELLEKIKKLTLQQTELTNNNTAVGSPDEKAGIPATAAPSLPSVIPAPHVIADLIDRILVDASGQPEIQLSYLFSQLAAPAIAAALNQAEDELLLKCMKLIAADSRSYTSARYLSERLKESGCPKSCKAVLPYLRLMVELGLLAPTNHPQKPYHIHVPREKLANYIQNFHSAAAGGWYAADGL